MTTPSGNRTTVARLSFGGFVNHNLVPVVLLLGAVCLASLAGLGVMMYKLESVEDKLRELHELNVGERLLHLEMRLHPKAALVRQPEPRAVAD